MYLLLCTFTYYISFFVRIPMYFGILFETLNVCDPNDLTDFQEIVSHSFLIQQFNDVRNRKQLFSTDCRLELGCEHPHLGCSSRRDGKCISGCGGKIYWRSRGGTVEKLILQRVYSRETSQMTPGTWVLSPRCEMSKAAGGP